MEIMVVYKSLLKEVTIRNLFKHKYFYTLVGLFKITGLFRSLGTFLTVLLSVVGLALIVYSVEAGVLFKVIGNLVVLASLIILYLDLKKSDQGKTGFDKANVVPKAILLGFIVLFTILVNTI